MWLYNEEQDVFTLTKDGVCYVASFAPEKNHVSPEEIALWAVPIELEKLDKEEILKALSEQHGINGPDEFLKKFDGVPESDINKATSIAVYKTFFEADIRERQDEKSDQAVA